MSEYKRKYIEGACIHCFSISVIAAKGYCRSCYGRLQRTGSIEKPLKKERKGCEAVDCKNKSLSNGLCEKHRSQIRRHGALKNVRPSDWGKREAHPLYRYWNDTKRRETLNFCDEWASDFWAFAADIVARPTSKHYLRAKDNSRQVSRDNWLWVEGITEANRALRNKTSRDARERKRVRVTTSDRMALMEKAFGACEICGSEGLSNDVMTDTKSKTLCVDHCHATDSIRGILCKKCNSAIGLLMDDTKILQSAIDYLNRFK